MSAYEQVRPFTREVLRGALQARGVKVAEGEDITAAAARFLADHAATAASQAPPCATQDYKTVLQFQAEQLRKNPFKHAPAGEAGAIEPPSELGEH